MFLNVFLLYTETSRNVLLGHDAIRTFMLAVNLVPRARDPLGRGTKGSGIIHLIIASDWLGQNVAI